ncbi:MAG TPA: ferredoxin [Bacteroidales bacterium]|nr:MAG: ferredoxin [Bacteroidetes bacterium GWF2_33_38]OFY67937.1 MAG: ferredoxin [Bacteroidetes bacterium RIFOXYA12_FULL_33_9]HBF87487.1 ferredoxin [Bacteroidales bacterium]
MSFLIDVNNKQINAQKGEMLLEVLKRNGIKVPTLCYIKDKFPSGACRMCVVENLKTGKLITACSSPVEEGMNVLTHSPRVVESRKTIVELLLSNHPDDCLYCVRNKNCELQSLSEELQVRERKIRGKKNGYYMDHSGASIVRDPDKCILCGRCVRICDEVMGVSAIDFINRGSKSIIGTTFNAGLNTSSCVNCGQCILVCPTGALSEKSHFVGVIDALNNPIKTVVVQYAPAISVSLAEEFNMPAGKDINGIMNAALRKIGFDKVFDTTFSADLTIMEEASELIYRIQNSGTLPMITSCCPGWIKFAEEFYPEFIPNLSSCKSPQQMLGAVIKSYWSEKSGIKPENIYSVSIMPCTAKKFEAQREEMTREGISDVDAVLTTRELGQLIRMYGVDMNQIEPETADSPHGFRSSAGKLFGASGGVMEAAIRTAYNMITGDELIQFQIPAIRGLNGRKEIKINVNGIELGIAVVNGLANARLLLEEIKNGKNDVHFIEVMACPGGCINGGGQHIGADENSIKARMLSLYDIDERETLKVSHKNPEIIALYKEFLEKPLGHLSHELLHTHYVKRDVLK